MKVLFVTQYEGISSSIILKKLAESKHKIIGVLTSKTLFPKKSLLSSFLEVIKKSGFRYFIMRITEAIYVKYYNFFRVIGFDKFKRYEAYQVKEIIKKYNLKHIQVNDINSSQCLKTVKELNPDIIVCCVFNQVFKKDLLNIPKYGCINIHRAMLPNYRGVSPTFWVLANDEKTTGITIYEMTEEVDTGSMLGQKEIEIKKYDTVATLSFRLMKEGSILLEDILNKIENHKSIKKIKIHKLIKYYSWPSKEAVKRFIKNKKKLF